MNGNESEILRTLQLLCVEGDTVELRAIGADNRIINGYYRNQGLLVTAAKDLTAGGFNPSQNIYIGLNPVPPALFARRADTYGSCRRGEGVRDEDIVCRRWLLVDIDPIRPTGISATAAEKAAAERVADGVYEWLTGQLGESCLVRADSGNGAHVLLRLPDVKNDPQSRDICERMLLVMDERFSDDRAKVDRTTFNAARICTFYGTVKRKGSDIPDRPHRVSRLVGVPEQLVACDWEKLAALVENHPARQHNPARTQSEGSGGLDIDQLLQERGVDYKRQNDYRTGDDVATRYVLNVCPFNPDHNDRSAYILAWPNGNRCFGCHHDGCSGKDWQSLAKLWGLLTDVTTADIQLPMTPMSPMSRAPYTTPASPMSPMSQVSLQSYIGPPATPDGAFHGPLGEICRDLRDYTEASPVAILACSLMQFGAVVGRSAFIRLDEAHFPKLYVSLVGATGSGRKGTADSQARRIIEAIEPTANLIQHSGLTTGEGLLQVLDENRDGLRPRPAVFTEREFAAVFRRSERKGNTLGAFVRDAWDDKPLANSTKNEPLRIEDHHVCLAVHCTPAELKNLLSSADVANGFANRFCWVHCHRTRLMPLARGFQAERYGVQIEALQRALTSIRDRSREQQGTAVELEFSPEAAEAWRSHYYPELDVDSEEDTQLGLMINRQPQQTVRIALILALADNSLQITAPHLKAARALVSFGRESLDYILSRQWWGEAGNVHDPAGMAPRALRALESGPQTRSYMIHDVFQRHRTAAEINSLRDLLIQRGRLRIEQQGRTEVWISI